MTDLERVRSALVRGRTTMNNPPRFLKEALNDIDAHLERDAAREADAHRLIEDFEIELSEARRCQERDSREVEQLRRELESLPKWHEEYDGLRRELTQLREAVRAVLSNHKAPPYPEYDRLRSLIEEKP